MQGSTPTALKSAISKLDIHKIVNHVLGIADKAYFVTSEGDAGRLLVEAFSEEQITEINALQEVYRSIGLNFRFTVVELTEEIIRENNLEAICNKDGVITNLHNASLVEKQIKAGLIKGLSPSNQKLFEERVKALEEQFGLTTNQANQSIEEQRKILERTYNRPSSSISRIRALAPDGYQVRTLSIIVEANSSPEQVAEQIRQIFDKPLIDNSYLEPNQAGILPKLADENGIPLKASEWPELINGLNEFNQGFTIVPNSNGTSTVMMDVLVENKQTIRQIERSISKITGIQFSVVSPSQKYASANVDEGKLNGQSIIGAYPNSIPIKDGSAKKAAEEFGKFVRQVEKFANQPKNIAQRIGNFFNTVKANATNILNKFINNAPVEATKKVEEISNQPKMPEKQVPSSNIDLAYAIYKKQNEGIAPDFGALVLARDINSALAKIPQTRSLTAAKQLND